MLRNLLRFLLFLVAFLLAAHRPAAAQASACDDLRLLKLPHTEVKNANVIAAGAFAGPGTMKIPDLPAFCRVVASVADEPDSNVLVEVWLPIDHWAGVFAGNGNGGFGGSLAAGYAGMAEGLRRGYASAVTDTGTAPATSLNGDPLIGHPRKWKDWGLLSTHVMTVTGKAIVAAFYGAKARHAYYAGCSTGGQQGLIEAQYYPQDYDGILVGAPVIDRTWGHAAAVWDWQSANREAGAKLTDAKLALLNKDAILACGAEGNGLASDPYIADALNCKYDPARLVCKGDDADDCLTPSQVKTAKDFYTGPTDKAGHALFYGWLPGSESSSRLGWGFLETPPNNEPAFGGIFKWVLGADLDWKKFDFTRDMPLVNRELGPSVNGVLVGSLAEFRARGGKLILYQGLADPLVPPMQTVNFYAMTVKTFGKTRTERFARLFLAPGVMHCGGGNGPNVFTGLTRDATGKPPEQDLFSAMTNWVENGVAPARVTAVKYTDDIPSKPVSSRRPLCAYPQKAWYTGGDKSDASNFTCAVHAPKR